MPLNAPPPLPEYSGQPRPSAAPTVRLTWRSIARAGYLLRLHINGQLALPNLYLILLAVAAVNGFLIVQLGLLPRTNLSGLGSGRLSQQVPAILAFVTHYVTLLYFLAVPFKALVSQPITPDTRLPFRAHLLFNAGATLVVQLVALLMLPIFYWLGPDYTYVRGQTQTVIALLVYTWLYGQAFPQPLSWAFLRSVTINILGNLGLTLALALLVVLTLALHILG
jgi:hypothetical protein